MSLEQAVALPEVSETNRGIAKNALAMAYWLQKRPLYNENSQAASFPKELDTSKIQAEFERVPILLAEAVSHFESTEQVTKKTNR